MTNNDKEAARCPLGPRKRQVRRWRECIAPDHSDRFTQYAKVSLRRQCGRHPAPIDSLVATGSRRSFAWSGPDALPFWLSRGR